MYFWNKINKDNEHLLKKDIDRFYTFDLDDVNKYGIRYNSQFYTKKIKIKEKKEKYDVCFLGRDKGRKEEIDKIKSEFEKRSIKSNIRVINNEKQFMPYRKYLKMIENSKCILDIVSNNQTGVSLRAMESLFFKKKLITNNKSIVKYDFYNQNNVFIIGIDKCDTINSFINSDYKSIDDKIVSNYDFENWLKRFLN